MHHRLQVGERQRSDAAPAAASPVPDWGKPEALMSLAYAHSKRMPPDLRAALDEANAALKLESEWSLCA